MNTTNSNNLETRITPITAETTPAVGNTSVVNSFNEWDLLEEVIVGVADGATVPPWHVALKAVVPRQHWQLFQEQGGKPFSPELISRASKDLQEFIHILQAEGIVVRRPEAVDHCRPFATPRWSSSGGFYAAMPRDVFLVIGNDIIEAPMAWRARYFEAFPYRSLLKDYFRRGARWTVAPRPELPDEFYDQAYEEAADNEPVKYVINDFEPTFDAADFIRCGKDIFYQKSQVTNYFGVEWLSRHVGKQYRFHELEVNDHHPMHLDATFMPLAPGKVLINPERIRELPDMFQGWDVFSAPPPAIPDGHDLYLSSKWVSMNILMLDAKRVIVEKHEKELIESFRRWGFKPIPCPFRSFNQLGGSFHCATLDIRRRGGLESYF
jgi:glycine amidinotransferase